MKYCIISGLLAFSVYLHATTYYVDFASGSDSNSGVLETEAWQHLPIDTAAAGNSLAAVMQPGDTILLKGGVEYRGKLLASGYYGKRDLGDGEAGNPIVLKGDGWGAGKAILDGSQVLTGWSPCASAEDCGGNANWRSIWYCTVPEEWSGGSKRALSLNLFQGEEMMAVAQYPNMPDPFYYDNTTHFEEADEMTGTYLTDTKLADLDDAGLTGAYAALWSGNNSVATENITAYDQGAGRIEYGTVNNPYGYYSILNTLDDDVFDRAGEYCYDESTRTLYAWPFGGADPNTAEITASVYTTGISFWTDSYITIEGFIIQKFIGQGISESGSPVVYGFTVRNNTVRFCRAPDGGHSINMKTTENSLIENNYIFRNAGPIRGFGLLGGSGHITRGNIIEKSGRTGIYYSGVADGMILNNRIVDNRGKHANAISTYQGCRNVLIAGNVVINSNIALTYENSDSIFVCNNILLGSPGAYSVACWGGQDGTFFYHNLIGSGVHISSDPNVSAMNNIFLGSCSVDPAHNINAGGDTAVDMTTIFRNAPVVGAQLADVHKYTQVVNVTTIHVADQYAQVIGPGQYLVYEKDGVNRTISSVVRKVYQGNYRTEIVFGPALDTVALSASVEIWSATDDHEVDYHLGESSIARDAGTDLSGVLPVALFPDYDFGLDAEGRTRSGTWDTGPFEYTASGVSAAEGPVTDIRLRIPNPAAWSDIKALSGIRVLDLNGNEAVYGSSGIFIIVSDTIMMKTVVR